VEDLLDRDQVSKWREEDAQAAAENRRRASWKARLSRSAGDVAVKKSKNQQESSKLIGWEDFERNGPLRKSSRDH
jgi:hypothetical protein